MEELRGYLATLGPGPIEETTELEHVLSACWHELEGAYAETMEGRKLHDRMEDASWNPPILSFTIERHGATALGSSRAELQEWKVDIDQGKAWIDGWGRRQVYPMAPRLNVRPLAEDLAQAVLARKEDERLMWREDGTVYIRVGKVIPGEWVYKQTLAGRRKRFGNALTELLEKEGWRKLKANNYAPPAPPEDSAD